MAMTSSPLSGLPNLVGIDPAALPEKVKAERAAAEAEALSRDPKVRTLPCEVEVRKDKKTGKKTFRFLASTEDVDSFNTVLLVDGWDLTRFNKNPVVLWAHNMALTSDLPPIGRVTGISKTTTKRAEKKGKKALAVDVEFVKDERFPFAGLVESMVEEGFIRGMSVGFEPRKARHVEDVEELQKLGFVDPRGAMVFEESELLEVSVVPVPSNPGALAERMKRALPSGSSVDLAVPEQADAAWAVEKLEAVRKALAPKPADPPKTKPIELRTEPVEAPAELTPEPEDEPAPEPTTLELEPATEHQHDDPAGDPEAAPENSPAPVPEECFECDLAKELGARCSVHGNAAFTRSEPSAPAPSKTNEDLIRELLGKVERLSTEVQELRTTVRAPSTPRNRGLSTSARPRSYVELVLGEVEQLEAINRELRKPLT